jgi:eukaryotic-like serine/threonine-protein kinase
VVYIGSVDGNVYALNARTGATLWKYSTTREVDSSPAVAGGVVYVDSYDGSFYALDAHTGALLWNRSGGYGGNSAIVANGMLYVGSTYSHTVEAYGLKK